MILGENLKDISIQTFRGARISSLLIKDSAITAIGNYCFQGCSNLNTVRVEADVASIGTSAFAGCTALTEICIDMSTVNKVDGQAFIFAQKYDSGNTRTQWYNLNGEKTVNLYNVTYIGQKAFGSSNLGSAEKIVWPRELKQNDFQSTVDSSCFRYCNIKGTFYLNVADGYSFTLDTWAVRGNNFDTIIIGNNVTKISGQPWSGSRNVETIIFLSPNVEITSSDVFKDMGSNISFYHNGLVTNTEFSQTNEIKITSGEAANYGLCGIYASVVTEAGETVVFDKTNHSFGFVDYDNTYCPMNTMGNYACANCEAAKQVANEGTNPVKDGHSANVIVSIAYERGFLSAGKKVVACSCGLTEEKAAEALFEYLGYSTKGDATKLCVGYKTNNAAINEYNSVNTPLEYGVVASANSESVLVNNNGTVEKANDKVIMAPITESYASFDFIITGFDAEGGNDALALVMCAYVFDGENIFYLSKTCDTAPETVTIGAIKQQEANSGTEE